MDELREVDERGSPPEVPQLDPFEVQERFHHLREPRALSRDHSGDRPAALFAQVERGEELREPPHRRQRRLELVRQDAARFRVVLSLALESGGERFELDDAPDRDRGPAAVREEAPQLGARRRGEAADGLPAVVIPIDSKRRSRRISPSEYRRI